MDFIENEADYYYFYFYFTMLSPASHLQKQGNEQPTDLEKLYDDEANMSSQYTQIKRHNLWDLCFCQGLVKQ